MIIEGLYRFASGPLALTVCVPLWNSTHSTNNKYYGAFCMDVFPSSPSMALVDLYYDPKPGKVTKYLLMNEDDKIDAILEEYIFRNKSSVQECHGIQPI